MYGKPDRVRWGFFDGMTSAEEMFLKLETFGISPEEAFGSAALNQAKFIFSINTGKYPTTFMIWKSDGGYLWTDKRGRPVENPRTLETLFDYMVNRNSATVRIPDGVKRIERYAFRFSNVSYVEIPKSVEEIGMYSFFLCEKLKTVDISSVSRIGKFAFSESGIESVVLGPSATEVHPYAFAKCGSLKRVEIEDGLSEVKTGTFLGCECLEEVVLPESVRKIGHNAFRGCPSLRKVRAPAHLRGSFLSKCAKVISGNMVGNPQIELDFF